VLAALVCAFPVALASADSFTPVQLGIAVTPVARLHTPLAVTVRVSADPGALDTRTAPLRVRVKLASECGGAFQYTTGVVLLDKRLNPQPATGKAYSAVARGSGKPTAYGTQVMCTWLEEEGDNRVFKSDQSIQTNVSKACTTAAARYDTLRKGRNGRRHKARIAAARRAARRACGPGVPL
jgi:hypothetical protein